MVMIRSGDNRQGVCPMQFLQEVWHDSEHNRQSFRQHSSNKIVVPVYVEKKPTVKKSDSNYSFRSSSPHPDHNANTTSKISIKIFGSLKNSKPISTNYSQNSYGLNGNRILDDGVFPGDNDIPMYQKPKHFDYMSPRRHYSFNSGNLNTLCGNSGILSTYFTSRMSQRIEKFHRNQLESPESRFSPVVGSDYVKSSYAVTSTSNILMKTSIYKDRKPARKIPILSSTRPLGLNFPTPKRMASLIGHRKISNSQERPLLMGYQTDIDDCEQSASFAIIPNKSGLKISPVSATPSSSFFMKQDSRSKLQSYSRPLLFMKP